jgi:hypothetical protein
VAAAAAALALVPWPSGSPVGPVASQSEREIERQVGNVPLSFERNRGQAGPTADYLARTTAGTFLLEESGARVMLAGAAARDSALGIRLPGASPGEPQAVEPLPGRVNHLVGDDPSRWRTDIPTFARVRYPGVWSGVDLEWYGDGRRLEYDFRLDPGTDPSTIAMRMQGAERLRLAANGDLLISANGGTIRQRAPRAYQRVDGRRSAVPASFSVDGRTVGFSVGRHDPSRPLVIDPIVLLYSTYLGGSGADAGFGPAGDVATAVDATGAAYVVGSTDSTDFDVQNEIEGSQGGSSDVVISKLDPSQSGASSLVYSTYLGGEEFDIGAAIAVDATGAAYVTGSTDSDEFNTVNPIEGHTAIAQDVFVAKLAPAGNSLVYSTYLGGTTNDHGRAIAIDSSGAAYVTGTTTTDDFDVTVGAFEEDFQSGNDAFAFKLNPAGSDLVYSTYLGGSQQEQGNGIAVDTSGSAYVTGLTDSFSGVGNTPFPTLNPHEGDPGDGTTDAFVTKLNPTGSSLLYSTYLGGNALDIGQAIVVDGSAAAYVTGQTNSTDFDNTAGALEQSDQGGTDAFVTKFTTQGNTLAYSTYLGGGDADDAGAIAVDSAGAAHVAGTTSSSDFPESDPIDDTLGGEDAFVSKLNPSGGGLAFSTRLGGADSDVGEAIAVDQSGRMVVAGTTLSTDFDTANEYEGDQGSADMFVSRLGEPTTGGPGPGGPGPGGPGPGPPPGGGPPPDRGPSPGGTCVRKAATIVGTEQKDNLVGTKKGKDVIAGLGGKDRIRGLGGKDRICGGKGKDKVKGGKGKDKLFGERGRDKLSGGKGNDKMKGGKGNDRMSGGPGKRDRCSGGGGRRDRGAASCERKRGVP